MRSLQNISHQKSRTELLSFSIEARFSLVYLPVLHCFSNECSCLVLCKLACFYKLIDEIVFLYIVSILSGQGIENFDEHLQLRNFAMSFAMKNTKIYFTCIDIDACSFQHSLNEIDCAFCILCFHRSEERRVGKECRSRWSP